MPSEVGVFAHGYQPGRETFRPNGSVIRVLPEVNERIFQECYRNVMVEGNFQKQGFVFSFYTPLREWMKASHPREFQTMREQIQHMPDREYRVLGDPFIHAILPLLPPEDQDMMIQMGRESFYQDFGFYPKGAWLPETAVSVETINRLEKNGYEYTVLADYQLRDASHNPMYVETEHGPFAVFHFASRLSGDISYQDHFTAKGADRSLWEDIGNSRGRIAIASDMELYGHHKPFRDQYLQWMLIHLNSEEFARHGFSALAIKDALHQQELLHTTTVYDRSSWSCGHGNLGRWTGEGCNCGDPSPQAIKDKQRLYKVLQGQNTYLNDQLDMKDPKWRQLFVETSVALRHLIFTGQDFLKPLYSMVKDEETYQLFAAKIYNMIGQTSCGWFFANDDSPERQIPLTMIEDVRVMLASFFPTHMPHARRYTRDKLSA